MTKIVVVGSANVDLIAQVERLPDAGETVLASAFMQAMGGKGANQAVAAARLGAEVAFIARLGDGPYAQLCLESYQAAGINTQAVQFTPKVSTGLAMIGVAKGGENNIIVVSGANALLTPDDVEAHQELIWAADALLLQLEIPFETVQKAVEIASSAGKKIILNPAPYRALPRDLLEKLTCITPNVTETEYLVGSMMADGEVLVKAVLGTGVQSAVITQGVRGSLVAGSWGWIRVPAIEVVAVDTTGAGDAFSAALTVGLAEGKPLDQAAKFATVAAGLSVTKMGAQPAMPTRSEVEAVLETIA